MHSSFQESDCVDGTSYFLVFWVLLLLSQAVR